MITLEALNRLRTRGRRVRPAGMANQSADDRAMLGPLADLERTWKSLNGNHGWNMIALPFGATPSTPSPLGYRLLLNQYDETLEFTHVDGPVENRGIDNGAPGDQQLGALSYVQDITQIAAADQPDSGGLAGNPGLGIHHEPGLWLHVINEQTDGIDIARLSTIPHGDSVLALGRSSTVDGAPTIPDISGLPIGTTTDLNSPYLAPYKHFQDNLFEGVFDPVHPNALLTAANQGVNIESTTVLTVDTTIRSGGILNIPFVERQADAAHMNATFWIQRLAEKDGNGNNRLRLQYSQVVILEFFSRTDGHPGRIQWPHVSIDTLVPADDG